MSRFAKKDTSDFDKELVDHSYSAGFSYPTSSYSHITKPGLSEGVVKEISHIKQEPVWMLEKRLTALQQFDARPTPVWGGELREIEYDKIRYYLRPTDKQQKSWEDVPKDVKATFDKLGIPEAEKQVLAGVKAQYDCLVSDARVFLTNGIKKIVDVNPGELVLSLNEESGLLEAQRVLALVEKGEREIFLLTTEGGREIKVTENHPFLNLEHRIKEGRKRGRYKKTWKYLSDLRKGDLVAITVDLPESGCSYKISEISHPNTLIRSHNQFSEFDLDISHLYAKPVFPKQSSEDLMWLLGFYLGDGCYGGKNRSGKYSRIEIAVPEFHKQVRNEVADVVRKLFNYELVVREKYKVIINSILLVSFFQQLGLVGNAHTKRVPEWVFSIPKSEKLAFIGGYFDADGGIRNSTKNKDLVLTSVSRELLNDIKMLALSCGLNTSHIWGFSSKLRYKGKVLESTAHRLSISGNISLVGSRMTAKTERFKARKYIHRFTTAKGTDFRKHTSKNIGFAKIISIEKCGKQPVYDIEVEGHHNFVANGIVVHNSEVVYGSLKSVWEKEGVVFLSMDEGLAQYPDLVREYFGKLIPSNDNKFSALNTAVWSGGSFVYVPKGVNVKMPLQAYFRINAANAGQFERTLIIVDEGASVHYIEGCTAPVFSSSSLHSAVVEIYVKKGARCQYTTVQNWYKNIYNLVTKRARVEEEGTMIWTDFNMGSKLTMKYPGFILAGKGARGETLSMAMAGEGQHQDTGSKAIHLAPHTSSTIISKSISKNGGRTSYRGMVQVGPHAHHSKNTVICDALLLDSRSRSDTYPVDRILNNQVEIQHEATVSKIGEEQLFYLMSRGISEENARKMIVNGFVDDLIRKLPLEYAVEMNRLIDHEMEGSIG